jgi:hypothetical protein
MPTTLFYRQTVASNTSLLVFVHGNISTRLQARAQLTSRVPDLRCIMHSLLTAVSDIFRKRELRPTIVSLLAERDQAIVLGLAGRSHWDIFFAANCSDALARAGKVKAQILFIDRDLAGVDWRETMSAFASLSNGICIVLVSRVIDAYLWNEVIRHGGYEVLPKPLREEDVLRAVALAWSYWNSSARSSSINRVPSER